MSRRGFTLVELFLTIFIGSVVLALALPMFRPSGALSDASVSVALSRIETAKNTLATRQRIAPGVPISLRTLQQNGLLPTLPSAPTGCTYAPGALGQPPSVVLISTK
jgi:prepilin-type N-terminal cleavage/methylation domain-containing protein